MARMANITGYFYCYQLTLRFSTISVVIFISFLATGGTSDWRSQKPWFKTSSKGSLLLLLFNRVRRIVVFVVRELYIPPTGARPLPKTF